MNSPWVSFFALIATTFLLAACDDSKTSKVAPQILKFTELGKVRIGMTPKEAGGALFAGLEPLDTSDGASTEACWYTRRIDGMSSWINYMVQDDKIVRIDVHPIWAETGVRFGPPVATELGITIDSSERSIIEKYGSLLRIGPNPYAEETGHYLEVVSPDKKFGILFETTDGKIDNFRAGTLEAIRASEGCS